MKGAKTTVECSHAIIALAVIAWGVLIVMQVIYSQKDPGHLHWPDLLHFYEVIKLVVPLCTAESTRTLAAVVHTLYLQPL